MPHHDIDCEVGKQDASNRDIESQTMHTGIVGAGMGHHPNTALYKYDDLIDKGLTDSERLRMQSDVRSFLEGYSLCEVVPEHSWTVVVDDRISVNVAIQALFEYKKPFVCLYNELASTYVGVLDVYELMAFVLHYWQFMKQCSLSASSSNQPLSSLTMHRFMTSPQSEPEKQLTHKDLFKRRASKNREFGTHAGIDNLTKRKSDFIGMGLLSEPLCGSEPEMETRNSTDSGNHDSFIEPLIPPWDYSLAYWQKIGQSQMGFPSISIRRSLLEALQMILDLKIPRVSVWSDDSQCPMSFLNSATVLAHVVQNLRGNFPVFDIPLKKCNIMRGENIQVLPESASIKEVIQSLYDNQWSSLPIVDSLGRYVGCYTLTHFLQLLQKSLNDADYLLDLAWPIISVWSSVSDIWSATLSNRDNPIRSGPRDQTNRQDVDYVGSWKRNTKDYQESHNAGTKNTDTSLFSHHDLIGNPSNASTHIGSVTAATNTPPPANISRNAVSGAAGIHNAGAIGTDTCKVGSTNLSNPRPIVSPLIEFENRGPRRQNPSEPYTSISTDISSPRRWSDWMSQSKTSPVVAEDITLRQAVSHILTAEGKKLFFVNRETSKVTGLVTLTDILRFLIGHESTILMDFL